MGNQVEFVVPLPAIRIGTDDSGGIRISSIDDTDRSVG